MFEKLMISGGYNIYIGQSVNGGWSLSFHALSSETTEKIANTDWDYVILQEQSVVTNPDNGMYPAVRELNAQVENIGAETILFMTWGRRDGLETAGFPNYESMQAQVAENYQTIGEELGLTIAPVGLVWQYLLDKNPNLRLWDADGSHPSKEGTYLAAAVFYSILTHQSPEGLDYLARISEETAQILQSAAAEAILGNSLESLEIRQSDLEQPKIMKRVDIGGYQLFIHCIGSGTPTVILEAGWNDWSETWSLVQPEVAGSTRVCAYDRVGLGNSSPCSGTRTATIEVDALHTLLGNVGVDGPLIFVGHSWGGVLARLYADRYQEDIAGLVLVDSSHPDMYQRNLEILPPESPEDGESLRFYRDWFFNALDDPTLKADVDLFAAGSLGDLPLVVLTVPQKQRAADFPIELSEKFDQNWVELHQELAQLSATSTHIYVEDSSHFIQHDQPHLVIDVILEMVEELR